MAFVSCNKSSSVSYEQSLKEYQHVKVAGKGKSAHIAQLNELGQQGWEVVGIETDVTSNLAGNGIDVGTTGIICLFKRECVANPAINPGNRTAWEYTYVQLAGKNLKKKGDALNELGLQGWELVATYTEIGPVRNNRWDINRIATASINYTLSRDIDPAKSVEQANPTTVTKQVEYKVIQVPIEKSEETHTQLLNAEGMERWELVSSFTEVGEVGVRRVGWRAGFVGTYSVSYILKRDLIAAQH